MMIFQDKLPVPPLLKKFYGVFADAGFKAYLVGGAVRDMLLGKDAADWDVATNATPQDVMRLFRFVIPTGIEHGTVTVHFMKAEIEVTTFRTESGYSDGRHPDSVNYAATIEEDLARRDFTMNAIAVNLADGTVVDPYSGRGDIKKKVIRTVGNAHERFMEDGLRPVRAVRFASKLGFSIENQTYSELLSCDIQEKITSISIERFRDEFEKLVMTKKPSAGLFLLEKTGILRLFLPEFLAARGCVQSDARGFHEFDVLDHLFYACDGAAVYAPESLSIRLAALFHDIGKPATKKIGDNGNITFYNHGSEGEKITRTVMMRLRFSNAMTNSVCHLVKNHMFHYEPDWTDAAVRRFVMRVGKENIADLFDLRLCDLYGMHNEPVDARGDAVTRLNELRGRIEAVLAKQDALSLKDLAVNGKDLIDIGIPAGKRLGLILGELLDCVVEDPAMNEREKLLEVARRLTEERSPSPIKSPAAQ